MNGATAMKVYVLVLVLILALAAPVAAQDTVKLPDGLWAEKIQAEIRYWERISTQVWGIAPAWLVFEFEGEIVFPQKNHHVQPVQGCSVGGVAYQIKGSTVVAVPASASNYIFSEEYCDLGHTAPAQYSYVLWNATLALPK